MRSKDIAYGGLMIATFLGISLVFRGNARSVQTYLEIIKTMIIAVSLRYIKSNTWWVFVVACFISCLFWVSISDTLIYNVPSIIGGSVIGLQRNNERKSRNYFLYFVVHSIMQIYSFFMVGIFTHTNLVDLYREYFFEIFTILMSGKITTAFMNIFFIYY